jgi:hypothetical protein
MSLVTKFEEPDSVLNKLQCVRIDKTEQCEEEGDQSATRGGRSSMRSTEVSFSYKLTKELLTGVPQTLICLSLQDSSIGVKYLHNEQPQTEFLASILQSQQIVLMIVKN